MSNNELIEFLVKDTPWSKSVISAYYKGATRIPGRSKELFFSAFKEPDKVIIISPEVRAELLDEGEDHLAYGVKHLCHNVVLDNLFPVGYMVIFNDCVPAQFVSFYKDSPTERFKYD